MKSNIVELNNFRLVRNMYRKAFIEYIKILVVTSESINYFKFTHHKRRKIDLEKEKDNEKFTQV